MVFGEIIEPTTRALIIDDEEFAEYPENVEKIVWDGCTEFPDEISVLTFIETRPFLEVFQKLESNEKQLFGKLKFTGVEIYKVERDKFVITSKLIESYTHGEIVEALMPWIMKAKLVYCLTSSPIQQYINCNQSNQSECFIRRLGFKEVDNNYKTLESPNLVTGLGAAVLSYCIHIQRCCSLYIVYMNSIQLDSLTAQPVLELIHSLKLFSFKPLNLKKIKVADNNLYM